MSFDVGINFRATSGYVTDGTGETYSLGEAYPTTRGGATFGWVVDNTANSRDRDNTNDRRLAGINFTNSGGRYFQIDLPAAGTYQVYAAAGDAGSGGNGALWDFCDTNAVLASLTGDLIAQNEFKDGSDVQRTAAAWPGSNAPVTLTFSTTAFRLKLRTPATNNNVIAHLRIQSVDNPATVRRARGKPHEPTPEYSW